jgi:DNA-directed RNA polymerase subunit M/transcription elongation factor TFIIS
MTCDKCGGLVSTASEYDTCVRCGKVNYDKAPNRYDIETPIVFKGNQNTLPYWGTDEGRMDTIVSVFTLGDKTPGSTDGRLYSRPMCPDCDQTMIGRPHARKADYVTKVSKTPYYCNNNHKIVIHEKQQVMMGWSE